MTELKTWLTDKIEVHKLRAGDCPPNSLVVLASALARLLEAAPASASAQQPEPVGSAIAAIRKVKESLDPDDWCGDESMIDALERAESALAAPPAAPVAQGLDERRAFEDAVRKIWTSGYACERKADGSYIEPRLREMWAIWQKRAALAVTEPLQGTQEPLNDESYRILMAYGDEDTKALYRDASSGPVGKIVMFGEDLKEVSWRNGRMPEAGTKLYAAPAPSSSPATDRALENLRKVIGTKDTDACVTMINAAVRIERLHEEIDAIRSASPAALTADYTLVKTDTLRWLLGEGGEFECPPEQYFRGKPAPFFWRKQLRAALLAASPANQGEDARNG